ncbi:MAG: GDP-mannose 4,6-dehydratase [Phycisphaerales bacterium]|nr:GDP-mannose 4,6-dehydratase [Phycisphaerales bacterium]
MPERREQTISIDAGRTSSGVVARSLVTGGSGLIGSHLVELLLARGDEVTVIDNLSTGQRTNLPTTHARLRFIEADLSRALDAFGKGERFDEVYHLAAAVGVRLVVDDPIRCIETNVIETSNLLRFAMGHGPLGEEGVGARTLIASSSEVYGKSEKLPFAEDDDVVYGPTSRSRWSYACTKAIDEYLALAYHAKSKLPVVVTRFFNTVGPRQVGEYGMVLPNFIASALKNEDVVVYGDGRQTRCFCDVRDVAEVLPRLLAQPGCIGRVFNVGSDESISIADLAQMVIRVTGSKSRVRFMGYDEAYAAGFEDLKRRVPDLTRVRQAIGFERRRSLEDTIRDSAAWMRERGAKRESRT